VEGIENREQGERGMKIDEKKVNLLKVIKI